MEQLITVNQAQCVQCGLCAAVCPARVLDLGEQGPEAVQAEICNGCGHCVAI